MKTRDVIYWKLATQSSGRWIWTVSNLHRYGLEPYDEEEEGFLVRHGWFTLDFFLPWRL